MAEIKRLILGLLPNQRCNLKCKYCYISQLDAFDEPEKMKYPPSYIALALSKERLGGTSLINLTGNGETLLQPEITELTKLLLEEGHFVEIVTNGVFTKRIMEILELPKEHLSRLFFKMSFHYEELMLYNLVDQFFDNAKAIHKAGASFTIELLAYDGIEKDIEDIKKVCLENVGAICQATIGRNHHKNSDLLSKHSKKEFTQIWKSLDSPMMDFKLDMLNVKRKEFCYAGAWSLFVNLYTGEAQPCYWQPYNQNIYKNVNEPIYFKPVGHACSQPFCINAHAHLTWGLIPELDTPFYENMRNRKMENGEEWLNEKCKDFFQTKLYYSNKEYTKTQKQLYTLTYPFRMIIWFFKNGQSNLHRVEKHIFRKLRWKRNGKE